MSVRSELFNAELTERPPLRRRRPPLSCIACRQRKLKCDRSDPCLRCSNAGISCNYRASSTRPSTVRKPRQDSPQLLPSNRPTSPSTSSLRGPSSISRAAKLTSPTEPPLPWAAAATATAMPAPEQHEPSSLLGHGLVRTTSPSGGELPGLSGLSRNTRLSESSHAAASNVTVSPTLAEDGQHTVGHQASTRDPCIVLNKTRMLRWSHWIGTAKEFGTVVECYMKFVTASLDSNETFQDPESRALSVRIGELIRGCKGQAKRTKIDRPTRCLPSYQFDLLAPPRDVSDVMVDNYFRSFESTHRILHVPTFRTDYESFWAQPDRVDTELRLKVLLVIAIGSSLDERAVADASFRSTIWHWVCAAQTWLSGPLEKDRLSITGLQIHCLTLLAREIFAVGGDLLWVSTGSLMHSAMQIGLHRDPKHFPNMPVLQAEIRRRLWATILEMTLQSSLDSALPARIFLDEFDTEAPSNVDDEDIDQSTSAVQAYPKEVFTSTSVQIFLLQSLPTRLRIVQLLNDLRTKITYADVLTLDSEITSILQTCSKLGRTNEGHIMNPFRRNLLDYLIRRFLIPLHCPFASQARMNRAFNYSLEASLSASLALISPEPDDSFSRLMAVGGGLFREGIRCASSIICLELLARAESQSLDGTLHRNLRHREILKQAMHDMIASSSERIRLGETNIKAHLFLHMVLAQVEAIEEGTPYELKIAKSAEESLTFCHRLISERVKGDHSLGSADDGLTPLSLDYGQDILGLNMSIDPSLGLEMILPNDAFY